MKKFIIALLIIVFCGLVSFVVLSSQQNSSIETTSEIEIDEVIHKTMDLEGHENLTEWLKVYTANVKAYSGRTQSIKNELSDFISTEQEEQMLALEEKIKTAQSILEQEQAKQAFEVILQEINSYKSQVEQANTYVEPVYQEEYVEPVYEEYVEPTYEDSGSYTGESFKSQGVIYENGTRYTWYSQNVLPGGGLDIPGRHVGDNDLIYDADGYVVVASDDYGKGTVVDTPFGSGKVYDSGCDSGTIDIYTNY